VTTTHMCLQVSKPAQGRKQSPLGSAETAVQEPQQTGPRQVGNGPDSTTHGTQCAGQRVLADTVSLNSQVENFMDTEVEHGDAEVLQAVNLPEADIQKVTPCHIMHMLAVPLLLPPV